MLLLLTGFMAGGQVYPSQEIYDEDEDELLAIYSWLKMREYYE